MCFMVSVKTAIIHKLRNKLLQRLGYPENIISQQSSLDKNQSDSDTEEEEEEEENKGTTNHKADHQITSIKMKSEIPECASSEDTEWKQMKNRSFILRKMHTLVRVFQERAEKVKERITQPPTPSPTPPPGISRGSADSCRGNRPRLESLIRQEDFEEIKEAHQERTVNFGCCRIHKKFLPMFPKVLDPQSKIYISWLFFVMMSYVYNAWVIVLRAVFPYQTPDNLPIFLTFDYLADVIYVIDIFLFKVRLQFLHDGFWVDDPEKTRKNYFRKIMFKMDVLSLLPLDLLYFLYGVNPLFRIPRLLKTQTFWEFFHRVDAVAKTPYVIRIIRTLLYMMYLIHLNACAYYAMSTWEGIGSNGWVFQGEGNAYIRCFYFATKTATSIGKNPKPENEYEYVFMTISWLMGVFIFAFLIGQIRDIVATATQSKTQYRQLMDQTVMYMRNLNLPDDLQRRVRLWLNHTWEQQKTLNESGILDSLPRKMKTDVAINVHYNTLVKVQLFKDCDKALLRDLVLQLKPVLFLPGDYICRKGEVGKEMYIVNKGLVQVIDSENGDMVLATLSEGSVFGEISLLGIAGCSRRTADVRSQGFSNLFVLSKDDLWEALKNYPEAQKVLRKKAKILIRENEARDKASKSNNVADSAQPIIRHDIKKPKTPLLLKTVVQAVPKDSKCIKMLMGAKHPPENSPTRSDQCRKQENDKTGIGYTAARSSSVFEPQIIEKVITQKPRSFSTTAIEPISIFPQCSKEKVKNPCDQSKVRSEADSQSSEGKRCEDTMDILKALRSLLPSGELHRKRLNSVHPKETVETVEILPKPPNANSSEDSGISIDMNKNRNLQKQESESSMEDSEDSSELSTVSSRRIMPEGGVEAKGTEENQKGWISPTPSVFSLRGLFRSNSNKSSKDRSSPPRDNNQENFEQSNNNQRSESITSSSGTSAGYENLAFLPVDVLSSRRSSMFSDTSC